MYWPAQAGGGLLAAGYELQDGIDPRGVEQVGSGRLGCSLGVSI